MDPFQYNVIGAVAVVVTMGVVDDEAAGRVGGLGLAREACSY